MGKSFKDSMKGKNLNNNAYNAYQHYVSSSEQRTDKDNEKALANDINKYSNMEENQLMNELTKVANANKAKGTLSQNDLKNFYQQVSPMLSEEQRKKLQSLISTLS